MNICGLQKLTLLDYPEHTACTVFLGGCNFNCSYCHNKEIVKNKVQPIMNEFEFYQWLETRKGLLDGVCISGGEPTLHKELDRFILTIHRMGFLVKLDTNGYKPGMINPSVDYIAMDIKNGYCKYAATVGINYYELELDRIFTSIKYIMRCGVDYEFRTTVTKSLHSDDDFLEIGSMIKGAKKYFLQKCTSDTPNDEDLNRYKSIMEHYVDYVGIRG